MLTKPAHFTERFAAEYALMNFVVNFVVCIERFIGPKHFVTDDAFENTWIHFKFIEFVLKALT